MNTSHKTAGAFKAKTHLSQLLDERARRGRNYNSKRGKPASHLVPIKNTGVKTRVKETLGEFDAIRGRVKGKVDIRAYISEGRKY